MNGMTAEQRAAEEAERRLFHAELLKFGASRCYRPGWAYRTFCARFGCSPPREWSYDAPAQWIRPQSYGWIRDRLIAYAQQRQTGPISERRATSKPKTSR